MTRQALIFLALAAVAACFDRRRPPSQAPMPIAPQGVARQGPVVRSDGTELPPYNTTYIFDQLIDHKDPGKGTFPQRYFFTWEWYQPGGPITLHSPGEGPMDSASSYLTNQTIPGMVAQALNGASVILEHRFFGKSNPAPDLTSKSLSVLTLEQSIEDLVYFAQNVKLNMTGGDQVTPDKAAWILFGGSYAGALVAWTMQSRPGIFWAGYASSAVVQAINYFWTYYEPIKQNMPRNCSADVQAAIGHVDKVLGTGTDEEKFELKKSFGMQNVTHNDDFAGALRYSIWTWQSQNYGPTASKSFVRFCDALEVDDETSTVAPETGFGLEKALKQWGTYWKDTAINSFCDGPDIDVDNCFTSYNVTQSYWTDTSLGQTFRAWYWMVCNEFGWFQNGAPEGWPSIVTRLTPPEYDLRQCVQMFPDHFKTRPVPDADGTNKKYGGWDMKVDRLFFADGKNDPWRYATMSSDLNFHTGTDRMPIFVSEGFHCSDMRGYNGVNPSVKAVQNLAIAYMGGWQQEWRALHPDVPAASNFTTPDPDSLPRPLSPPFEPTRVPEEIVHAPHPPLPPSIPTDIPVAVNTVVVSDSPRIIPNAWGQGFE